MSICEKVHFEKNLVNYKIDLECSRISDKYPTRSGSVEMMVVASPVMISIMRFYLDQKLKDIDRETLLL